ncbi:hypothetical protein WJX73_000313 [Symbiochloris irregularis]|uniref:Uncharacterized protein n=1 Tax=Symbiochloris irregularis TaxID=706552 RepID=A0AAW1P301_9CHLO
MAQALRSRLGPLVSKAQASLEPAYKWSEKQAANTYDKLMKDNQQYVVKDKAAADKLGRQLVYTNLAKIPEVLAQNGKEWGTLRQKASKITELPLTEVGTYLLFAGEVYAWSCVGEIIGRGSVTGYSF